MMWTLLTWGLVALPAFGLTLVVADLFDAWRDLMLVEAAGIDGPAALQARHNVWSQAFRGLGLAVVATMAVLALAGVLNREWLTLLIYALTVGGVTDAWRARRSRKRIIGMIETG